jgi:hypothetical protein
VTLPLLKAASRVHFSWRSICWAPTLHIEGTGRPVADTDLGQRTDIKPEHSQHRIRHGVMWRKTSFGTDSPNGSRFVERILTVVTTLRMQGRNVLDYVTTACEAALQRTPPPSLLPA